MSRIFAQINCSILQSRKLRQLNPGERWAYVCTHLTSQCGFSGVFSYPNVLWAQDAGMELEELIDLQQKLVELELLELEPEDELVRIVGFHRKRPPENGSRIQGMIADLSDRLATFDGANVVLAASAEFAVSAFARSSSWPKDKDVARKRITDFIGDCVHDYQTRFISLLQTELGIAGRKVRDEIKELLPNLEIDTNHTV